jgi:hypothetical protein
VRGGLSGKNEEGCVRVGVLTRDGGATAFCEADGGGNDGISGGAADVAHRRGRGELGGAELRWPLCAAGGFEEEKWREGGAVDPGLAMEKRGEERKRGGSAWAAPQGGRRRGAGGQKGARPVEAVAGRRRASRGGEGHARGPCAKAWGGRGKE